MAYLKCPDCMMPNNVSDDAATYRCFSCFAEIVFDTCTECDYQQAIPSRWHTEALLHARPYTPDEALGRGMVDGVVPPGELLEAVLQAATPLAALDQKGYATSKARQRAMRVRWAADLIESEMVGLPRR